MKLISQLNESNNRTSEGGKNADIRLLLKQFKLIFSQLIPINLLCQILDSINLWSRIKHL